MRLDAPGRPGSPLRRLAVAAALALALPPAAGAAEPAAQIPSQGVAIWDGSPAIGGAWVAHAGAGAPREVVVKAPDGTTARARLLPLREGAPGAGFLLSAEIAQALGVEAGEPVRLTLLPEPVEAEAAPEPTEAPQETAEAGADRGAETPGAADPAQPPAGAGEETPPSAAADAAPPARSAPPAASRATALPPAARPAPADPAAAPPAPRPAAVALPAPRPAAPGASPRPPARPAEAAGLPQPRETRSA
ncbi:MAG: hypothetical protein ACQEUZ_07365 [Pseudomonadota bacterium]